MLALHRPLPIPRLSRFAWLMGMYAENYHRLRRLLRPQSLAPGRYESTGADGLVLVVEVLEIHAYTVELRLSYRMRDPVTGQPDPSAYVRYYRDARQAEATHCYVGRHWQDVLGLRPTARELLGHRLRMNTFLGKWLEFLTQQGHGPGTFAAVADREPDVEAALCG